MYGVSTWEEARNLRFIFKELVHVYGVNMYSIHPLKQRVVQQIHEALKDDKHIDKIVLFGSAINVRCRYESDLYE